MFDLSSDPHEDWNLSSKKMDSAWMLAPVFRKAMQYEMSLKEYTNIKPGEEFKDTLSQPQGQGRGT